MEKAARGASSNQFLSALMSDGPSPELGDEAETYGWLVGSWDIRIVDYKSDGQKQEQQGEWHISWVLEGRAIQDIFIVPRRDLRDRATVQGNRYGSTLRMFDPSINAWRVYWRNPVTAARDELIGQRIGNDIVQEGTDASGNKFRWVFDRITADSFHWFGERSYDGGISWRFEVEFFATRSK